MCERFQMSFDVLDSEIKAAIQLYDKTGDDGLARMLNTQRQKRAARSRKPVTKSQGSTEGNTPGKSAENKKQKTPAKKKPTQAQKMETAMAALEQKVADSNVATLQKMEELKEWILQRNTAGANANASADVRAHDEHDTDGHGTNWDRESGEKDYVADRRDANKTASSIPSCEEERDCVETGIGSNRLGVSSGSD